MQKSSLRYVFKADVECYEKTISTSFPIIKRKHPTLMLTPYCQKRRSSFSLEFVLTSENIRKAHVKKFSVMVYLTEGYESIRNKIDHLCLLQNFITDRSMFLNYIGSGEKQVSHHLYRGHHISSLSLVCL